MKAGVTANLFALDALSSLGLQLTGRVVVQSVIEEESTGNGTISAFHRCPRTDAVLIPEPSREKLVRANVGVLWFRIKVRGIPAHVREAGVGANAIDATICLVQALQVYERRRNEERFRRPLFQGVDPPIVFNPGLIKGGEWASSVPTNCSFDGRISFFPDETVAAAKSGLEGVIAAAAAGHPFMCAAPPTIEWNGFLADGYSLSPGSDAEEKLAQAHEEVVGEKLADTVSGAYLDARVFANHGIPTFTYGPYSERGHGVDERVSLPSLKRVTTTIALFLARWCGAARLEHGEKRSRP